MASDTSDEGHNFDLYPQNFFQNSSTVLKRNRFRLLISPSDSMKLLDDKAKNKTSGQWMVGD